MKTIVNVNQFCDTLAIATRVITSRITMPVLGCVLLKANAIAQRIHIIATNLDASISVSCPAEIDESGTTCVPGKRFQSIVSAIASEKVEITMLKNTVVLSGCTSKFRIHSLSADEFPLPVAMGDKNEIKFSAADLRGRIKTVASAMSNEETRYMLNGIYLHAVDESLRLIATDGRRLHANVSARETGISAGAIIPAFAVERLLGMIGDDGDILVKLDEQKAYFSISRKDGDIEFITKVVEGNYPNWKQVLPKYSGKGSKVVATDFCSAVKRVALACSEKSQSVKITFGKTSISMRAESPENGDAEETFECVEASEMAGTFAVNPRFLIDALTGMDAEQATILVDEKNPEVSPVMIVGESVKCVIMPVRLQ